MLTESLLLSVAAGVLGLLLTFCTVKGLVRLCPSDTPRLQETSVDLTVLGFTLGVAVLTGLLFGMMPAWRAADVGVGETLKEGSGRTTSRPGLATPTQRPGGFSTRAVADSADRGGATDSQPDGFGDAWTWASGPRTCWPCRFDCRKRNTPRRPSSMPSSSRCWNGCKRCRASVRPRRVSTAWTSPMSWVPADPFGFNFSVVGATRFCATPSCPLDARHAGLLRHPGHPLSPGSDAHRAGPRRRRHRRDLRPRSASRTPIPSGRGCLTDGLFGHNPHAIRGRGRRCEELRHAANR